MSTRGKTFPPHGKPRRGSERCFGIAEILVPSVLDAADVALIRDSPQRLQVFLMSPCLFARSVFASPSARVSAPRRQAFRVLASSENVLSSKQIGNIARWVPRGIVGRRMPGGVRQWSG